MLYMNLVILSLISIITFIIIYLEWGKFSKIYHNNYTFFDLVFIIIYPFEEILFLFLYYLDDPLNKGLWVSLIVLAICLTVGIDKLLLRKQNEKAIFVCRNDQEKIIDEKESIINKLFNALEKREIEKKKLIEYISRLKKNRS